ncbi:insulin receptor substrate 1 [Perognathus longimembris pacificus]|uniref:insulin receptor substrate 1 n=1 Tax=Perognathus longimembris pacificus TaxID=214514 RepID=UPI0020194F0F|nr:insulin receptor substrate 1 [Perognathus longimembris pacificus]
MASPPDAADGFSDVRKVGYLRKPKSMHKRFFVLRAASEAGGPARLEYYENEKKWRHKSSAPKRSIPLESCFNINKRADSKNKHLVALYTRDEHFAIAADSEAEQDSWYQALLLLHTRAKGYHDGSSAGSGAGGSCSGSSGVGEAGEDLSFGETAPGPAFKEVWQVILKPKGLGQTKNLIGIYRLCLTSKTISFVKLNSEAAAVVLQLMNIRRCGHSENFFFIEVGRSAVTGPGEFWMQVDDSVVAQNMHETILEAMRAMSDEFRPRSKSQSSSNCSNPISVPLRRHHLNNPPPSQVGLTRRSRTESITATSPASMVGGKPGSFRVRASSDGEGTMSRPASVDGSPVSPSTNRTHAHRHRGSSRLHPPLNHSRSIPMPSRCSPSATSPVSLSSSSTSGHGSTSDCLFPRRSSASVSGSPSDGGFISSDEYGSSPCDFRSSFRSVTPDSLGHTPPARGEEELSNYICMGGKGASTLTAPNGHYILPRGGNGHRYIPGSGLGTSPALAVEEAAGAADLDNRFRKRTHSAGTSPTISHQKTPSQSCLASTDEYTEMMPAYPPGGGSGGRLPGYRHSAFVPTHSYPEEGLELHPLERRGGHHHHRPDNNAATLHTDDGYMPMSPGVAPVPNSRKGNGDYMPMSPKSVSAPQQIINPMRRHPQRVDPNGYMMMSPSGSCSPDIGGASSSSTSSNVSAAPSGGSYGKLWTNGVGGHHPHALAHPKPPGESGGGKLLPCTGDYMNMSPVGDSNTSSPSDCYYGPDDPQHKPVLSYYSLPRSFKHTQRPGEPEEGARHQHLRLSSSSGRLLYATTAEDSSSSTSSDSLGGGHCGVRPEPGLPHPPHHHVLQPHLPRKVDTAAQTNSRLARPTRLSLGDPKASTLPRAREQPPPPQPPHPPEPKSPGEYVNIEFGSEQPGYLSGPRASHSSGLSVRCPSQLQPAPREEETGTEEYMNMDLGPGRRAAWQESGAHVEVGRVAPAPPGAASVCRPTRAMPSSRGDYMTMQMGRSSQSYVDTSPVAPVSYADMRTGLATEDVSLPRATAAAPSSSSSSSAVSASPSEPQGAAELPAPVHASLLGAPQGPGGISAFTRVNLSPNRNQSAKVIRADPQGCRRRHSSETFSSAPTATRAGNTVPFGAGTAVGGSGGGSEEVKRHSSASFENVWLRPGELGGGPKETAPGCGAAGGVENGLNYIDLDLVKDFKQRPQERPPPQQPPAPPAPHQPVGSSEGRSTSRSSEDLSTYASISFQKQPEDRQ